MFLIVEIILRAYTSPEVLIGKAFLREKFGSHFCAVFSWTSSFFSIFSLSFFPCPFLLLFLLILLNHQASSLPRMGCSSQKHPGPCLIAPLSVLICSVHSALILPKDFHFSYNGLWYTFLSCLCFYANCLDDKTLGNPCTSNHHRGWFQGNWLLFWKTL